MRYDPQHKARTRDKVLKEAAAALRNEGPERLGVAGLMSRAGLTHGGFYAHFASKSDLLAEAVDYMFADIAKTFFPDNDKRDPRKVLSFYVNYYLSMAHRDARCQGCPVPILLGEMHRLPEEARVRFAAAVERMLTRITFLLEGAGVSDARRRAGSAVAEMVGTIGIARATSETDVAKELLATALRSVRYKLVLDGADS